MTEWFRHWTQVERLRVQIPLHLVTLSHAFLSLKVVDSVSSPLGETEIGCPICYMCVLKISGQGEKGVLVKKKCSYSTNHLVECHTSMLKVQV